MCSAEDRIMGNGKILCGFHTNDITGTGGLIRITRIKGIVENGNILNACTLYINDGSGVARGNCPPVHAEIKPIHRHIALGDFNSTVQSDVLIKFLYDDASGNPCNRGNAFEFATVRIQIGGYIKCHNGIRGNFHISGSLGYCIPDVVDSLCIRVLNGLSKRLPGFFCSNEILYVRHIFYSMLWFLISAPEP